MSRRLKVLLSAYACEPGKGSEPEVGWQWALQMARFHDVTVLTRSNNRPAIEQALESLRGRQPLPGFIYHDESPLLLKIKRRINAIKFYYILWQRSARHLVTMLQEIHQFDLLHHVTFAGFRYPAAIWGHGVPCVWGPIGGIESIPRSLLPWFHPRSFLVELARNANNLWQSAPFHMMPKRARASTIVLASTAEMQRTFVGHGIPAQLMPTIGLNTRSYEHRPHSVSEGPLKLLFVGNIITLKGVDLALCALKESRTAATFTLVGDGDYLPAARRLVNRLGLQDRVVFRGRMPREQVLKIYAGFDLFLFPSLHDTGGYAVLEAMLQELPVICLDCGGPALVVREDCGVRVPLGPRAQVISSLAAAIRKYDQDRSLVRAQGAAAREVVQSEYDWDRKGAQMDVVYRQAVELAADPLKRAATNKNFTGVASMTGLLHRMVSFKGMLATVLIFILIGAFGFNSISHLKREAAQIVGDTLPGLATAGEANANLAKSFDRTLLLLMTDRPELRVELIREIGEYTKITTNYWEAYSRQINSEDDRANFQAMIRSRETYLAARNEILQAASANRQHDAMVLCHDKLLPAYARYKEAGEKLLAYNIHEGQVRGKAIMKVCTTTQMVAAMIGIGIFILGFLIGLFK